MVQILRRPVGRLLRVAVAVVMMRVIINIAL
jgi:hypothetical protein